MKQLKCPLMEGMACLEENCAIWVPKGVLEKTKPENMPSATKYEIVGCCAIRAIAETAPMVRR